MSYHEQPPFEDGHDSLSDAPTHMERFARLFAALQATEKPPKSILRAWVDTQTDAELGPGRLQLSLIALAGKGVGARSYQHARAFAANYNFVANSGQVIEGERFTFIPDAQYETEYEKQVAEYEAWMIIDQVEGALCDSRLNKNAATVEAYFRSLQEQA